VASEVPVHNMAVWRIRRFAPLAEPKPAPIGFDISGTLAHQAAKSRLLLPDGAAFTIRPVMSCFRKLAYGQAPVQKDTALKRVVKLQFFRAPPPFAV
jgi:hypothetical protein